MLCVKFKTNIINPQRNHLKYSSKFTSSIPSKINATTVLQFNQMRFSQAIVFLSSWQYKVFLFYAVLYLKFDNLMLLQSELMGVFQLQILITNFYLRLQKKNLMQTSE